MAEIPRVFISYSHDSEQHRARVLALSERLRRDGLPTDLDRYVNGTPPEGWPRWMLDRLDAADRVLLICTPTYYRRFRGHEAPDQGKGVDWEGAMITQAIYDAHGRTARYLPVLFDPADEPCIPEPVRGRTFYCLTSEAAYQALYDALLDQAGIEPGPVGAPKVRPRPRGEPLRFDDPPPPPATRPASPAVRLWAEKLEFLREQEAICSDPAQRFTLKQQIAEYDALLNQASAEPQGAAAPETVGWLTRSLRRGFAYWEPARTPGAIDLTRMKSAAPAPAPEDFEAGTADTASAPEDAFSPQTLDTVAPTRGAAAPAAAPRVSELAEEAIRLDVAAPAEAIVDEPFELAVTVRQPTAPVVPIDDLPNVASAPGKVFRPGGETVIRYRIEVSGPPGCVVTPGQYTILLKRQESAEPRFFRVTCPRDGKQTLLVNAYQEDEALAAQTRVRITVSIGVQSGNPAGSVPPSVATPPADAPALAVVALWREKLECFQREEAITADPAQRFQLRKLIDECRAKLRELGSAP